MIRPAIVLTPGICDMPAHVQEAIACHELLHVQRRDWLYEILEAAVVTVLWFHPAIWMLIGRIRLAREQVVDEADDPADRLARALRRVAARGRPRATVSLVFTGITILAAAPSEEAGRPDSAGAHHDHPTPDLSLTASAAALALAAAFAVRSFPLEAQERAVAASDDPIQLVKGGEHLLHGERPEYPRRAIEQRVEGDVQVEMTLDERGEVSDARVLSGPEELRKATLESVLQWHYSPAALASTTTYATLRFRVPPPATEQERKEEDRDCDGGRLENGTRRIIGCRRWRRPSPIRGTTDEQRVELKLRGRQDRARKSNTRSSTRVSTVSVRRHSTRRTGEIRRRASAAAGQDRASVGGDGERSAESGRRLGRRSESQRRRMKRIEQVAAGDGRALPRGIQEG